MTHPDVSSDTNVEAVDSDTSPPNVSEEADIGTTAEADVDDLTDPILPVNTSSEDDVLVTDDVQPQRSDGM